MPRLDRGIQFCIVKTMERAYYTYIMASERNGTLYIGVTNNLIRRVHEHRTGKLPGFTKRYRVHKLVWFGVTSSIESAILMEKRLKKYPRKWKINLIEEDNPHWNDLWDEINHF